MKIKKITYTDREIPMCDIEVANAHCYSYNGVFVHNSNKQKAEALLKVGIDTGIVSDKSGQMKLDKDSLDMLAKKYHKEVDEYLKNPDKFDTEFELEKKQKKGMKRVPYEVIAWLIERSTLRKQLSSYTEKLSKIDRGFINYNLFFTQTGRLSSSGGANEYFMPLNYQNLTKPKPSMYRAIHKTHPLYDSELFTCQGIDEVLDYRFKEVKEFVDGKPQPLFDSEGNKIEGTDFFVESTKKELNIRSAITVPNKKDWLFCSMDYEMEEGKIMCNYCKEPNWLEPIKNKQDLHTATAIKMFGEANYDKTARKKAKGANFSLIYLGTWRALQASTKMSEADCKDVYKKFWSVMVTMKTWGQRLIQETKMEKDGNVFSYFGRPRRLKNYLLSDNDQLKMFGERSVISHTIQATGADIMRIVLVQLYKQIFSNKENLKEIQFSGCVHDEINNCIHKDHIYKWYPIVKKIMEINRPDWELPMTTALELSPESYGTLYPFVMGDDGVLRPKQA